MVQKHQKNKLDGHKCTRGVHDGILCAVEIITKFTEYLATGHQSLTRFLGSRKRTSGSRVYSEGDDRDSGHPVATDGERP